MPKKTQRPYWKMIRARKGRDCSWYQETMHKLRLIHFVIC